MCCSPWGRKELDTTGQLNNSASAILLRTYLYCCVLLESLKSKVTLGFSVWVGDRS